MDSFCRGFVEDVFLRRDNDCSNVLQRKELKGWVQEELRTHKYLSKKFILREFDQFFRKVDYENSGKIDRWQLYKYCLKNMTPLMIYNGKIIMSYNLATAQFIKIRKLPKLSQRDQLQKSVNNTDCGQYHWIRVHPQIVTGDYSGLNK